MKPWSMDVKQNICDSCLVVFAVVGLHVGLHVGLLAHLYVGCLHVDNWLARSPACWLHRWRRTVVPP